jgi:hypothetical protein
LSVCRYAFSVEINAKLKSVTIGPEGGGIERQFGQSLLQN